MTDIIRRYCGEKKFRQAETVFERQTRGTATIRDAFAMAGPLTRGVTLRQAIEYAAQHVRFVTGFTEFVDNLHVAGIPMVINSTAYSVTFYALRERVGRSKIHGFIGNTLKFGEDADPASTLSESELEALVARYFSEPDYPKQQLYDRIQATGFIELGIRDEAAKATLVINYTKEHLPDVTPDEIAHMGDSMGDSSAIYSIARGGGLGIAFNYNKALETFLREKMVSEDVAGKMVLVEPKSESSDLRKLFALSDTGLLDPFRIPHV